MDAPRENLARTVAFSTFETRDNNGDGLTLEGYGAVANQDTVIDSWEGNFVERFAPGAWKRTISTQKPVMQFDHGRDSRVGSTPIGSFEELRDDENGLYVRARLHDNEQVKPVRDAIASGAISGMSVRMTVVREKWDEPADATSLPVRTIQEARLYEVGPVVFPAYTTTSVGVRDQAQELARDAEFRAALFDELRAHGYMISEPADDSTDSVDTSDRSESEHNEPADTPEGLVSTSDNHRQAVRPDPRREDFDASVERLRRMTGRAA